jgi:hypothetical protein
MRNAILNPALALLAAIASLSATGCVNDAEEDSHASMADSVSYEQRVAFDNGQDLWWGNRPSSYSFRISRTCVCSPHSYLEIFVGDDKVVKVDTVEGESGLEDIQAFNPAPDMDQLFRVIQQYLINPEYVVKAAYDDKVGYPTSVVIHLAGNPQEPVAEFRISEFRL